MAPLGPAKKLYDLGYLTSTFSAMAIYTVLCKISPPKHIAEAREMPFEAMGKREVLTGLHVRTSEDIEEVVVGDEKKI